MEKIIIDGIALDGFKIPTENANIILIKAAHGFLGCGYFNMATADRLQEHVAIVTGVKTFDDMLEAKVVAVSAAAETIGIKKGMSGRDAILKMT
ncbi:MAG: DUF1805 domain-containing protein [Victivallaceae bacterium]